MMWNSEESDDEVFFGEITLKEIHRALSLRAGGVDSKQRQTLCATHTKTTPEDDANQSIKIIETHSTPNLITASPNAEPLNLKCSSNPCLSASQCTDNTNSTMSVISVNELAPHMESFSYQNITNDSILTYLDLHKQEDSFQQIDKLVNDLSVMAPDGINEKKNEELDDTVDVLDDLFFLINGPNSDFTEKYTDNKSILKEQAKPYGEKQSSNESKNAMEINTLKSQSALKTPTKIDRSVYTMKSSISKLKTPNIKTPIFKTPGYPVSHKKKMLTPSPLKKQFEHVVSPVASYINHSPVAPLLQNVRPKKPLNGTSFIPQPIKSQPKMNVYNKENSNLPSTAYRSAKETQVINIPDEHKLPQSQWAKRMASSQKGVVMRHIHRENGTTKKPLFQQQEDSFSNLTLHQADLSVCTQKSAVKKDI